MPLHRTPLLLLASASPRRRDLLSGIGLRFRVWAPEVPERARPGEAPRRQVMRLAAAKARAAQMRFPAAVVVSADTLVVLDGAAGPRALGKPRDDAEAHRMLRRLSDRTHRVLTGVALALPGGTLHRSVATSRVTFWPLTAAQIRWYVSTGDPRDKAGAYGAQGGAALFIRRLQGSWSNVVGLPLERLPGMFAAAGLDLLAWTRPQVPHGAPLRGVRRGGSG